MFGDLCDDPDPTRLLDSMEATGLVGRANGGGKVLFTMPAPVRVVLREQYDSSVPSAAQEFHRRLAVWFGAHSEENHTSLAFHHAVLGKDWDLMDQLWSENVPDDAHG